MKSALVAVEQARSFSLHEMVRLDIELDTANQWATVWLGHGEQNNLNASELSPAALRRFAGLMILAAEELERAAATKVRP